MKSQPILIMPAMLILIAAGFITSLPGGAVSLYLVGAALSLWPLGFSGGWPKYLGLILGVTFIVLTGYESRAGIEWERKRSMNQLRRIHAGIDPREISK
jgi:hypothetical protein